jgi:RNA polymerase sigma factor (sigma-70 family)
VTRSHGDKPDLVPQIPGLEVALGLAIPRLTLLIWRRFGVPREHAEDAVQDVVLKLVRRFRRGQNLELLEPGAQSHLENYLAKAAYRRALDLVRAERRRDRMISALRELGDVHGEPAGPAEPLDLGHLRAAVAALPRPYRPIFELLLEEDITLVEVARLLSRKPATVQVQFQRGLTRLRRLLQSKTL